MKKIWMGCTGIMLLVIGTGCGAKKDAVSENFQKVVDEYAQITLRMDEESALVDTAYEAVADYLENQNMDQLQETAGEVESVFRQLVEKYNEIKDYEVPDEIFDLLGDYDILYEDFESYVSEEKGQIYEYLENLDDLYEYLSYEATDMPMTEDLAFHYEMVNKLQEINRKYMYTGINYWFAGRSEAELAYLNEAVTDKLVSFCSDGHEWDSDQANVEDRMNAYLDELADLRLDWEIQLGEKDTEQN